MNILCGKNHLLNLELLIKLEVLRLGSTKWNSISSSGWFDYGSLWFTYYATSWFYPFSNSSYTDEHVTLSLSS